MESSVIQLPIFGALNVPNMGTITLGPVDIYLSQTIMQAMQIMDMKAWAVLS